MGDEKNMELSDDVFAEVSGGVTNEGNSSTTQYDALGVVFKHIGNRDYEVHLGDGAEIIATAEVDNVIREGTPVGLIAKAGGWIMQEIIR